ncbi:MAG: hypothetical protein MUE94_09525 [Verrucomicrobia bacterium]|jgi:hypothetical protein|nr:hypothetical protein [Verrucomicrobiota bacterium]
MDWQQGIALLMVGLTAALFLRAWRRRAGARFGCGSQCGCDRAQTSPPRGSVIYRARKGERPQIITRLS